MEGAAMEFVLNNLKDLLINHANLITDSRKQIESLDKDLRLLNAFVTDSQRKRRKDDVTKVLIRNIRDVVYEVEYLIDIFVIEVLEKKSKYSIDRLLWRPVQLHEIGGMVKDVKEKVERARIDFVNLSVHDEEKYRKPEVRPPRHKDVVGFADVTAEMIHRLSKKTDYLDVVCLIGMLGLGKTTLAWKIFNDKAILYQFPVRIWLSISQEFTDKDIFLAILKEFTNVTEDVRQKDGKEIAQIVASYLKRDRFLIVMDDVWTRGDWDRLKDALPTDCNKGKVLITSRIEEVGKYACNPRPPHLLRFFTQDESWELLRLEALRKPDCPRELESIGQLIAGDCKGLPLAIVIIGGILATKNSDASLSATRKAWEKVSKQVSTYLNDDPADRMNNFISLSYDKLPHHLRSCFLYLGVFPEDHEISASRLILLWIAEGFIKQSNDYSSLEELGEKYLDDLINRNLVRTEKVKYDGKVKTCRIHDSLREFCRTEGGSRNDQLFQEIKSNNGVFVPPLSELNEHRRLSIHSNCLKFISSKPTGDRVRSFLCFSKDECVLPLNCIADILTAFRLLRVLDVNPLKFPKVNIHLFQLFHMRYIAMSSYSQSLPAKLSELWHLQTLIFKTTSRELKVQADIWKLIQLRHFKTNASASLPKPSKDSKHGVELRTLGMISVESCTTELFEQACNLKKLGIRGKLTLLLEGNNESLVSLGRMKNLENLKLINDVYPDPPSAGILNGLPLTYQFPSGLKSLTLRATFLSWSNMSILGLLANLEVLKLKDKAFMGNIWEAVDGAFLNLEFLHIEDTDLAVWTASSRHYPRLTKLVLQKCEKLTGIPTELADIAYFHSLELYTCNSAVASAREIEEAKKKAKAAFKLLIFPPAECVSTAGPSSSQPQELSPSDSADSRKRRKVAAEETGDGSSGSKGNMSFSHYMLTNSLVIASNQTIPSASGLIAE